MSLSLSYTVDIDNQKFTALERTYLHFNEALLFVATFQNEAGASQNMTGKTFQLSAKDPEAMNAAGYLFSSTDISSPTTDLASGIAAFAVTMNGKALAAYLSVKYSRPLQVAIKQTTDNIYYLVSGDLYVRQPAITGSEA